MKTTALLIAAALAASACAPTATPAPPAAPGQTEGEDTCGMANFRHLIGTPAADIERAALPPRTRVITPDMMVTQDFVLERLNIIVGADGRVGSLRCF